MARFKYILERPVFDPLIAERAMDFEATLSKALRTKRLLLIRNTALITALASALVFGIFYIGQHTNDDQKKSGPPEIMLRSDTLTQDSGEGPKATAPQGDPQSSKVESTPATSNEKKAPKTITQRKPESKDQQSDSFKIRESFGEQTFTPARPFQGFDSLYAYFKEKLVYPERIKKEKIEGKVVVSFLITKNGSVSDITVTQKLQPVLDSIAISSVKSMPRWSPAVSNGEPVDSRHSIPLIFNIETK